MMERYVYALVEAEIKTVTPKAVLIGPHWFPRSQIRSIEYDEGGDSKEFHLGREVRTVLIPEWLAEQKNLGY